MTMGLETVITSRAAAGRPGPAAHTPAPPAGRATQREVID
jgi:hypothetical protein